LQQKKFDIKNFKLLINERTKYHIDPRFDLYQKSEILNSQIDSFETNLKLLQNTEEVTMKDDEPIFVGIERARILKLSFSKALDTFQELQNFQKKIDCPDYDELM